MSFFSRKITPIRLYELGFDCHPNYKWPDGSVSELLYTKGSYFVSLTNNGTIWVFAKFYNQNGGKPDTSIHLRNITTMGQIKRLFSALTS